MKKIVIILILISALPAFSRTISGEIKKENSVNGNRIYDSETNRPIENVTVKIPAKHYITKTNKDGIFQLKTDINSPTIMALEKNGYKPYSMTLNNDFNSPINIGIEKTTPKDIIVETDMIHIGDNSFSLNSANANDFALSSTGSFYSKDFNIKNLASDEEVFIKIGSIIGIDTYQAQQLGQSNVKTAYSSAPELFFNGNKIAEIKINGDNQKINVPKGLIKCNGNNNITIKTGRNLYKRSSIDFDDIEFTNLLLEVK